jgi:hypothetical protein
MPYLSRLLANTQLGKNLEVGKKVMKKKILGVKEIFSLSAL